jgi:dTDP-4-amino-4,6-dideoxygalactose transaminase
MTSTTWDRHRGHAFSYDVEVVGTNARFDELRAAIGLVQLGKLRELNTLRGLRVARYRERLANVVGLGLPFGNRHASENPAYHLFVVLLPDGCDRASVMSVLRDRGIQTSIHYPPTHRFRAHCDGHVELPVTDAVVARLLTLPLYPTMTQAQVNYVCDALISALG